MPNEKHLSHYTINTGHLRGEVRSEVNHWAVESARPMLAPGEHVVRAGWPYRVRVEQHSSGVLMGHVTRSTRSPYQSTLRWEMTVCTFVVCDAATPTDEAWRLIKDNETRHMIKVPLTSPCLIVRIGVAATNDDLQAMSWLGDSLRTLAWAWIEHREREN